MPKSDAEEKKPKTKKVVASSKLADVKPVEAKPEEAPVATHKNGLAARVAERANDRNFRSGAVKVLAVAVGLVAVVIVIFGVLIYGYKSENPAVKMVASVVPYPVLIVNNQWATYNNYLVEVDGIKFFTKKNASMNNQPVVDYNSADGKKLVVKIKQATLDKLKSDAVVSQLAKQKKVSVSNKDINDMLDKIYQNNGGKDTVIKAAKDIYGWNLVELKSELSKQLLQSKLSDKVTSDPAVDAAAKAKAQDVLKKLKDGGDFAALAKQYSQASDAASGGDLGFFTKGQLPDNLQAAAEALQPGQISDAVKTQYGYEVIKVIEKKDDGSIHAQHILIKTVDFTEYLQTQITKAKTQTLIKI